MAERSRRQFVRSMVGGGLLLAGCEASQSNRIETDSWRPMLIPEGDIGYLFDSDSLQLPAEMHIRQLYLGASEKGRKLVLVGFGFDPTFVPPQQLGINKLGFIKIENNSLVPEIKTHQIPNFSEHDLEEEFALFYAKLEKLRDHRNLFLAPREGLPIQPKLQLRVAPLQLPRPGAEYALVFGKGFVSFSNGTDSPLSVLRAKIQFEPGRANTFNSV